ncbi:ketoacyl-synt-domain-containing protein [Agrocybe pediades]|nr:ketoacyl-synt-domain-containing protein [Agrocybe pediades]
MLSKIAIIGISAELPSGSYSKTNLDHHSFFEFLLNKGDSYEKVPLERFQIDSWKGSNLGQIVSDRGSFLKGATMFDHVEFGITAKDAKNMALSTRKLIEHTFLSLLDAGIDYRGKNIGCYMSGTTADAPLFSDPDEYEARGSFAGYPSTIANRVSYHLDLLGPSIPTDTACSSSLVALHLAVQALRAGDCETAVVGGSQMNQRLVDFIQYSQGSLLSKDGKCKPFDVSADGFSRGEGVCVIVLKPLDDAIRDGDHIYASVLGTGVNSSGSAAPVNAPVAVAQADAMLRAYKGTGRKPEEVDFIELHATGTAAGDPTEVNWRERQHRSHLEITSFLASLSKVCSILETGLIPPNVHLSKPNPAIQWDHYRLRVPTEVEKIGAPRIPGQLPLISMTSSGLGGANGHAVIEGPPKKNTQPPCGSEGPILLMAGGLSPRSTLQAAWDLTRLVITRTKEISVLSSVYGRRSRQMTWRSYAVWKAGVESLDFCEPRLVPRLKTPIVFVFSGQGPQHIEMGRQLYKAYQTFRDGIDRMDRVYEGITGHSLVKRLGLFGDTNGEQTLPEIWPIEYTLPALAMIQMAMFDLLVSFGVLPDVVVGHSAGETPMLYASGSAPQEMVMEIAIARGRAMTAVEKLGGSMAALSCQLTQAQDLLAEVASVHADETLDVACYNSSDSFTLSGSGVAIDAAVKLAKAKGFMATKLRTKVAVHSRMMEACREIYLNAMNDVFSRYPGVHQPNITTYSSTAGRKWTGPFLPEYYWHNARQPVLFADAITAILDSYPTAAFIEISPHPVLSPYLTSLGGRPDATFCPMRRFKEASPFHEKQVLLDVVGQLVIIGCNSINFFAINQSDSLALSEPIPPYPFSRKHVPVFSESSQEFQKHHKHRNGPLNDADLRLGSATHPDLAEHVIMNEPIMPAAGFLEMIFELGARLLWNVEFKSMMPIPAEKLLRVHVLAKGNYWAVKSRPDRQLGRNDTFDRIHADGYMSLSPDQDELEPLNLDEIRSRCQSFDPKVLYDNLHYFAQYGPKFRRVASCFIGQGEGLVEVRGAEDDIPDANQYVIHPAILDACFHIAVHPAMTANNNAGYYYLPSKIKTILFHNEGHVNRNVLYSHVVFKRWQPQLLEYDMTVTDIQGRRICTFLGVQIARHQIDHASYRPTKHFNLIYQQPTNLSNPPQLHRLSSSETKVSNPKLDDLFIFNFRLDDVLQLQKKVSQSSRGGTTKQTIWVLADLDLDGFAARGFTRALRKELFTFNLHLVLLHSVWRTMSDIDVVCHLAAIHDLEPEILIDRDGLIRVPRLVPVKDPTLLRPIVPTLPLHWLQEDTGDIVARYPSLRAGFAIVRVMSISPSEGGFRGFVGVVEDPGFSDWEVNSPVFGVYHGRLSNLISIHAGQLARCANMDNARLYADAALPLIILSLSLGLTSLRDSKRLKGIRICLTEAGFVSTYIGALLSSTSASISIVPPGTNLTAALAMIAESDLVLSGHSTSENIELVRSNLRQDAEAFFWNDSTLGISKNVKINPWFVGDSLRTGMDLIDSAIAKSMQHGVSYSGSPQDFIDHSKVEVEDLLFDHSKTYLLIGGIGSFGLHVALWMYEQGARRIILTSRSGRRSLEKAGNVLGSRILSYLESLDDLDVQALACDASSESDMTALLESIPTPLGGCILMSAVLSDRLFISHTHETFFKTFTPKHIAFQVLQRKIDIPSLDFLVSISSVATWGNVGQTNYSSANSLLDGMIGKYRNAFALLAPAINDSTVMGYDMNFKPDPRFAEWTPWSMDSRQLCVCLGHGIRALSHSAFEFYVPDFDWNKMRKHLGSSPMYDHLVQEDLVQPQIETGAKLQPDKTLKEIVLDSVDIAAEDFSPEVPLTSYGLDSLSAGILSHALAPFLKITQMQLLADVSLNDLEERMECNSKALQIIDGSTSDGKRFDWTALHQPGQTVVKLVDKEGIPLILVHGIDGNFLPMMPLKDLFSSPLWVLQTTPETPLSSLEEMASFYFLKIKQAKPFGPYRLGGYSASSLLSYEIARLLEANGDELVQFLQIDHFPTLYISPHFDQQTIYTERPSKQFQDTLTQPLLDLYAKEPSNSRRQLGSDLSRLLNGGKAENDSNVAYYQKVKSMGTMAISFILRLAKEGRVASLDDASIRSCLERWMNNVKVPVTVLVASRGFGSSIADPEWSNFGADKIAGVKNILVFDAGHFDIFEKEAVARTMETSW